MEILANKQIAFKTFIIEHDEINVLKINGQLVSNLTQQEIIDYDWRLNLAQCQQMKKYEKYKIDGEFMVNQLMSELRLYSQKNNLSRNVNKTIELAYDKVIYYLITYGWWITALEYCNEIVVGGYITQELYDRIHLMLTNYIAENY